MSNEAIEWLDKHAAEVTVLTTERGYKLTSQPGLRFHFGAGARAASTTVTLRPMIEVIDSTQAIKGRHTRVGCEPCDDVQYVGRRCPDHD